MENGPISLKAFLPSDDLIAQCIHCGMCLATCPTYDITKKESSSPRGRIRLIKSFSNGELELTDKFIDEMSFCLDCQACETACPAGVKYGKMVESVRDIISNSTARKTFKQKLKSYLLNNIVGNSGNLKLVARLLYFIQRLKLIKLFYPLSKVKFVTRLIELEKLAPRIDKKFSEKVINEIESPYGEKKYRAAFLTGCIMNVAFTEINKDTIEVLKQNHTEIITPKKQNCCGSLHAHNGEMNKAIELAKEIIDKFLNYEYDYLVSNSAGCGAFMKEYIHWFENDDEYREKAKLFSSRVVDLTEYLMKINFNKNLKAGLEKVTYHDACHLCHTQKITNEPRRIINSIYGINYVELEESTWCCGSAGIYNVTRYDDAMKFLDKKMKNIINTNAEILLTGNPGCIGQIKYGVEICNKKIEVIHPATYLRRCYDKAKKSE